MRFDVQLPVAIAFVCGLVRVCAAAGDAHADPARCTATPSRTKTEIARVYELLGRSPGDYAPAGKHLRSLPTDVAIATARAIAWDGDAHVAYLGTSVLVDHGCFDAAVPALAAMVADGRNETQLHGRLGYDWTQADDPTLFPRLVARIDRHLLDQLDAWGPDGRARAEAWIMAGTGSFSTDAARKRIDELEHAAASAK